jgi:hypothetical protein
MVRFSEVPPGESGCKRSGSAARQPRRGRSREKQPCRVPLRRPIPTAAAAARNAAVPALSASSRRSCVERRRHAPPVIIPTQTVPYNAQCGQTDLHHGRLPRSRSAAGGRRALHGIGRQALFSPGPPAAIRRIPSPASAANSASAGASSRPRIRSRRASSSAAGLCRGDLRARPLVRRPSRLPTAARPPPRGAGQRPLPPYAAPHGQPPAGRG